jgi:glucose/arabinose dehydrogenase
VAGTVPISFTTPAQVAAITSPTQAAWGPDGRLYVVSDTGNITIYTFDENYSITDTQVVTTIAALSNNSILGVAFNPVDPPNPVKLYVAHSQLFAEGGGAFTGPAPYTGQILVLTGPNFSTAQPLITQLPVSNHDHGVNGLQFENNGDLFIANGSATNAGIPSTQMGTLPESPLSGAILKALLSKATFNGALSYVETATGQPNNDQVYGDRVDLAPGTDVSVFTPGTRNPFDIVWTTRGKLYGSDNGANANFGATSTSATTQGTPTNAPDEINYLVEGHYYGHPNRNRGRYDDRQNVYHLPTDPETFGTYDGVPLATVASSSDGSDEYRATTFNSRMRGDLLVQKFNGVLYHAVLSADGLSIPRVTTLATTGGFGMVTGPGGAILSFDHNNNKFVRESDRKGFPNSDDLCRCVLLNNARLLN